MIFVKNEHFVLEDDLGVVYISVHLKGFPILNLNAILLTFPQIVLEHVKDVKQALTEANGERIPVGRVKPIVEVDIAEDKMSAHVKLNCSENYLNENHSAIVANILENLQKEYISDGILMNVLQNELTNKDRTVIALGKEPVHGKDAVVTYFKRSERKPAVREDGKADYYDMSFLDEVKKGDWLGERIPPSSGEMGRLITGELALPRKGKDKKLLYDKKTIAEYEEEGKIVLRALIDGVVEFRDGKITVGAHLLIDGDVGIETGNIEFDGSVTVKGTVMDHFSMTATKDISILSELGVCNVEEINSKEGDVFIKGGIFGKGLSKVSAGRNIFVKYANECHLTAGENIHIGSYSLGSFLKAKNIFTDEKKGKLIGGVIEAQGKVRAAVIGNRMERKTIITVKGFNRNLIKEELNQTLLLYKSKIKQLESIKEKLEVFDMFLGEWTEVQQFQYEQTRKQMELLLAHIFQIDGKRKSLMDMLESKGEGEITIGQMAFPHTRLQIKSLEKKLDDMTKGTFYAENNHLHFD
ncbi:hypothetical protein ABE28_014895 [Peribacillus muralis]|uniref:Flagellar Assembly Protein A N-terminal region domain-containing protein n=1 Tax=Peribacillus muralis TaxID=264697 RepID=A0A1B3XQY8_9BACI|nr:FapA family protein [Peribacillus muralis]AOH55645.1 hypothetical protein ABE28_014895 [Peribacillus muralis]